MGSRKIKRRPAKLRTVRLNPDATEAAQLQSQKFRDRFGRQPGRDDRPLDLSDFDKQVVEGLEQAGMRPEIIYAYKKTGLLVSEENIGQIPKSALAEWEAAVQEYFAMAAM